jgi:hypothetical protein
MSQFEIVVTTCSEGMKKFTKTVVRIVQIPTEFRTEHLRNTTMTRHQQTCSEYGLAVLFIVRYFI